MRRQRWVQPRRASDQLANPVANCGECDLFAVRFTAQERFGEFECLVTRDLGGLRWLVRVNNRLDDNWARRRQRFPHDPFSVGRIIDPKAARTTCLCQLDVVDGFDEYETEPVNRQRQLLVYVQLSYLLQVVPTLKNIAVLYSESNTSAKETQVKPLKGAVGARGIAVLDVVGEDHTKARDELAVKVAAAAAEMRKRDPSGKSSIFWITGSTPLFSELETINRVSGGLPVLSVVPDLVQEGRNSAVLSIGVNFDSNAYVAAIYATDI